ncbi:hypothetical protein [Vibrio sp.]|uniref:hypothetical protein n=1 Tax=Vibrio sp. TaxID=678 RepID=UPI0031200B47
MINNINELILRDVSSDYETIDSQTLQKEIDATTNFPERELTDDDIEEINRIGDQVKMLQQTLKYWLSICRDEQMAIARNI